MGTRVVRAEADGVVLHAPLDPNQNHRATAFGGSLAAQGILAGWALVHVRLDHEQVAARTVIQHSEVSYLAPVTGDFEARTLPVEPRAWRRFRAALERWGRGRIRVAVEIVCGGSVVVRLEGDYVALAGDDD